MLKTSPENIKCVCQTLKVCFKHLIELINLNPYLCFEHLLYFNYFLFIKLCGYELDIDFPKETEELMKQLSSCENTDVSTHRLLSSVIELRKIRWGRNNDNNGKIFTVFLNNLAVVQ